METRGDSESSEKRNEEKMDLAMLEAWKPALKTTRCEVEV